MSSLIGRKKRAWTEFLYKKCPMEPVLQISKEFVTGVEEQGGKGEVITRAAFAASL